MQWIKCCEERIEKFEALMDEKKTHRTDSLWKIRACSLQVLKVFCVRFMLISLSKAFKMPAKILKIHCNLWC